MSSFLILKHRLDKILLSYKLQTDTYFLDYINLH